MWSPSKNFIETLMPTKEKESSNECFDGQFVGITLAEDSLKPWEMETVNTFHIEQKAIRAVEQTPHVYTPGNSRRI